MKKLNLLILSIVLIATTVIFTGCGNKNDGYTEVLRVDYTIAGTSTTLSSTFSIVTNQLSESTIEEYNSAPKELKFVDSIPLTAISPLFDKSNITKYKDYIGKTLYLNSQNVRPSYYKTLATGLEYNFYNIKIIDNKTLMIKMPNGEIQQIFAESYKITYFK